MPRGVGRNRTFTPASGEDACEAEEVDEDQGEMRKVEHGQESEPSAVFTRSVDTGATMSACKRAMIHRS